MRKKLLILTCVLSMSVLMVACGSSATEDTSLAENQTTTTVAPETTTGAKEEAPTTTHTPVETTTPEPATTSTPVECTNHKYVRTVSKGSTCTTPGHFEETCTVCGYVKAWDTDIRENEHTQGTEWLMELDAAEGEVGIVYQECVECHKSLDRCAFRRTKGEVVLFTWRKTTDARNLYWTETERANAGHHYMGEDFNEVLQMMEDPTITFNEEHFYDGSVFAGCKKKHVEFFVANGYTLHGLINEVSKSNVYNVFKYFESIGKPLER
jgi:hypothetical protein